MSKEKRIDILSKFLGANVYVRLGLMIAVTILYTIIFHPDLIATKHSYKVGDIAERDIKSPKNFFIEDKDATEAKREQSVEEVSTVYDHDTMLYRDISDRVNQAFHDLRTLFESPDKTQEGTSSKNLKTPLTGNTDAIKIATDRAWQEIGEFEEKIGIPISKGAYSILVQEKFSVDISNAITDILTEILLNGVVIDKEILLKEIDKGIVLKTVGSGQEKTVKDLKLFYGLDEAKTIAKITGQSRLKDLNYSLQNLIVDFVQKLIQPNITLNKSETEQRKNSAFQAVKPVLYKIKAGEMLLREGERVTEAQILKLQALQDQINKGQILISSIGVAMLIFYLFLITTIINVKNQTRFSGDPNKSLLFISTIFIVFILFTKISVFLSESFSAKVPFSITASSIVFAVPLGSSAMLVCLFMGFDIAIPFALIMSVCAAGMLENRFEFFIYFLLSNEMAAYWVQNCRERNVIIKAGLKLGLLNLLLAIAIALHMGDSFGLGILWNCIFAFMGGVGAGIITTGFAPVVEIAFDYTTDIKLLELANLDRPILRRLMIEAPGTYHHSIIVGTMVEAAASEINANPLLAKVCGYYHDIGKIKKPLYFVENQANGKNKHDKLAPSMSSLILISHIKDGVEIARKNKLGGVIADTINQHHGTSLIRYFYEKAQQIKGKDSVKIGDFRYPGPKPQTKEAGLVMLADVVEAASRTLENPTPARIQGLVQNLINNVFSDGQLDNCELTLKDLHNIAKSFNKILNGIHHHRIEYTENPVVNIGKRKDGNSDRQQAKQAQDLGGENKEKSPDCLKRLGLS
ncbi:MAG TPA: HDIG domain-containing protein [Desulfobacterales bacterium]|nr:HDIG domain-containing protein [Desulfobacterales bacterium]